MGHGKISNAGAAAAERSKMQTRTSLISPGSLKKGQAVVLLRWVLIIATSYVVLFTQPASEVRSAAALFVALYLASNVVLASILPAIQNHRWFDIGVVLVDTIAVSIGLALTEGASSDFFLLYFVVMFLGALTERLGVVVGAAVLISVVHMYTVGSFIGYEHLIDEGYILRIPFLLVVALFFGHLVENTQSAEKAAAEARQRETMKTEFLASVTHDLKNPLGLIESMAAALLAGERGPLAEPQADLVRRIHANSHRVISLSLNLLDAARVEAGMLTLQRTPARLADVVEDAVALSRSAADSKGVSLGVAVEPGLPAIEIDFMQMGRVVSNLLDNAIKYTPTGTAVLVSVSREDDSLLLAVHDDGPGIPQGELEKVFEKYRRRAGSNRIHGSGLGLFIVRHLVEAHGGRVTAQSIDGEGTSITVRLPLGATAGARPPRVAVAAPPLSSPQRIAV